MSKKINSLLNVFIVDDDDDTREYISSAMFRWKDSDYDFNVNYAVDGMDCINKMESEKADIIISDMRMPRMNGAELIKNLRTKPGSNQSVPVIIISAYPDFCNESGVETDHQNVFVLPKPFDIDEFYEKINTSATIATQER